MFFVLPGYFVRADVDLGALVKGHRTRLFWGPLRLFLVFVNERISASAEEKTRIACFLARVNEAHFIQAAEPHFMLSAVEHETEGPAFRTVAANAQIEAAAISIHARLAHA